MTDYAGPILGAVGAVFGNMIAPGVGAQWGWMIGSTLGGMYAQSQRVIPGPKIGDVPKQTQQEGGFRPIVFGRSNPLFGNVIADGGPVVVKSRSSGKGGPKVETESAYRTYAVGFCEGEAELLQAWRNGILVYDVEDPNMAAENAKFLEYARWYKGDYTQVADPALEEIYGAGNAPYFRGTAYLLLHDEDVTDQRGMWSQWQVRVFRRYDWKQGDPLPPMDPLTYDPATLSGGSAGLLDGGVTLLASTNAAAFANTSATVSTGDWYWEHNTARMLASGSGINHYCYCGIVRVSDSASGFVMVQFASPDPAGGAWSPDGLFDDYELDPAWVPASANVLAQARIRNRLTFSGGVGTWQVAVEDGPWHTIVTGLVGPIALRGCSRGTSQDSGAAIARRATLYTRPEDFKYDAPGSALPIALAGTLTGDWSLAAVVREIALRANLPDDRLSINELPFQVVRGFTIGNAYPAAGSIQALASVFFFDPYSAGGKVNFVARGRDAVATIYESDMIDNGEPIEDGDTNRKDSIAVPRVLHLNYFDIAGGLNTDKQRSERPGGTRADGEESLQTAVVMSADEAATVVAKTHGLMVEQHKGELNFSLPDRWLFLTESDPVFVQVGNKMVRAIITKVTTDDGEQHYRAIRDRQSLYTTQVQGIPAAPVTRPPSSVAGPTVIEFIDTATLRDSQDLLGFRLAVSGIMPAWPGAFVEFSLDGGANYIEGQVTRSGSVMGQLITPLGDHPAAFPDTHNRCQIQMQTPDALLEVTDLRGMMNRRNRAIIGDELVTFADPDEVSPGVWDIGHWLRGRDGTETVEHAPGERFVMIDTTLFIPAELSWLGRDLTFRATTLGRPLDEATIITVPFVGRSQIERRPAYLSARRDNGDAVIAWQGVGRLGGSTHVAMGVYFQGFRVTVTDGTTTQTFDTTARSLTVDLAPFAGPVTIRVQQRNALTGFGPHIEVTI